MPWISSFRKGYDKSLKNFLLFFFVVLDFLFTFVLVMNNIRTYYISKIELKHFQFLCTSLTDYLLGGSLVMRNGKIDNVLFEGGYAQDTLATSTTDKFAFYFYIQDHLGNNCEVVDAKGVVQQVTNYYPFGAPYADATAVKNANLQQYKYNGKELDLMHGLNTYDYGARQHDPILARWDRMDPLCEDYYPHSPYNYCLNNPVKNIDYDGRASGDIYNNKGEHVGNDNVDDGNVYLYNTNNSRQLSTSESYKLTHTESANVKNITQETGLTNGELNLRSTLSTLKQAEAGKKNNALDYNSWNQGAVFTKSSYKENPKAYAQHPGMHKNSSAAGAYQFLKRFYPAGDTFSPTSQDKNAIKLMNSKSYQDAVSGDILKFQKDAGNTWTSLRCWTPNEIKAEFNSNRSKELLGTSQIASPIGVLINIRKK